jgi:hypothetical protein
MAAHRYWRLIASAVNGGTNNMVCAEMELRATPGGADQASGGTALSSGITGGSPASNAFDNNATTNWVSNTALQPWWLGYDFGSAVSVQQVAWQARSTRFDFCPITFNVQYSDDSSSWTTQWSGTWTWSSNGQINISTDPAATASARPVVFVCT